MLRITFLPFFFLLFLKFSFNTCSFRQVLTALVFSILLPLPSGKSNSLCCCCLVAQSCPILCDPMECSTPGLPVPHHFPKFAKFMSIGSVMPSSHFILWRLLLLSVFPCVRDFSKESAVRIRWLKYWSFNFSFSDSSVVKESACNAGNPGLIPGLARSSGEGIGYSLQYFGASLVAQLGKDLPAMWRPVFCPWVGRFPGEGKGYPLQYSGLENSMDCIIHRVPKSQTQLSDFQYAQLQCQFFQQVFRVDFP